TATAVVHGRGEGTVAQVAQDTNLTSELIGDDDVLVPIIRDVRQGQVRDAEADWQSHRGQEGGDTRAARLAVVEEDRDAAVARVWEDEFVPAGAVEVSRLDLGGERARGERPGPDKATVAPGIERDGVIGGVHAGEQPSLIRVHGDDVTRGVAG